MARGTFDAVLVGLRFHQFTASPRKQVVAASIELRRERSNPHDSNAVVVCIDGRTAGHIDRKAANIIAPILDGGGKCAVRDFEWSPSSKSIAIKITIESDTPAVPVPSLASGGPAIYRISIRNVAECYVGQAQDVRERIKRHWRDLGLGVHANPALRQFWNEHGGQAFSASVLETAPAGLTDLQLSHWLKEREEHWIEHHDARGGVLNFDRPGIVLVGEDREDARRKRLADRARLRANLQKREEIDRELARLRDAVSQKQDQLQQLRKAIQNGSGLRGFFFADDAQRREVAKHESAARKLETEVNGISAGIDRLLSAAANLPQEPVSISRRLPRRRK